MKKQTLFLLIALLAVWSAKAQKKEHIITHNKEIVVTDPSKGRNSYKRWAEFPSEDKEIRQIKLNLTFECPDKMRCADWDYLDHVLVRRKNDTTSYEIARMLTPYGGRFQNDWLFDWNVDVTDFSKILRDSLEVEYVHTGYEDNKARGWKVTVDFEITYGTPVAKPAAIHKIYDGSFAYGDKNDPIESHLKPVTLKATPKTAFSKMKIHQTGHGMDANGCGEFCDKYREIVFNGKIVDHKNIWMECGDNPLYPQAGTWIFDRANWCPGYLLQPDEVLLNTQPGETYTVDLNMEPYEVDNPSANELIVGYVIEYEKINAGNDVALVDIIQPSTGLQHSRKNPTGGLPVIRIKNNGKDPLKKMDIKYYLEGQKPQKFKWTGDIPFGETAVITLPNEVYSEKESARFYVELEGPNGKKDAFQGDNQLHSIYQKPNILPENLVVYFKTNNKPGQNSYKIEDSFGNIIFQKDSTQLKPDTIYQDTVQLKKGNYSFTVDDSAGNGLEFWFHSKDGRGDVKLLDTNGKAIKQFESDFGSNITYNFAVRPGAEYGLDPEPSIAMFPSRTEGPITLDYFANDPANVKVVIVPEEDETKVAEEHSYPNFNRGTFTYNLSYLPKMRYYMKVFIDDKEVFKNRIRLKE